MKKMLSCLIFLATSLVAATQNDFTIGTKYPEGVTAISKYIRSKTKSENRYGLLDDRSKKVILPIFYRSIYPAGETNYFIVKDTTDKVGIFSIRTGFVISPQYEEISQFQEGVAIVRNRGTAYNNIFGAVDKSGNFIIPLQYDYVAPPSEGLLNFRKDGKFGYLNLKNEIAIPARYTNTGAFVNGLAPANETGSGKHGFINKSGEWAIQPSWTDADNFYEGYANVYTSKLERNRNNVTRVADTVGLIDTKGKMIIPAAYNKISYKQGGGLFIVEQGDKSGLIDSTGKMIMPLEVQKFGSFSNGVAILTRNGKQGIVNQQGKIMVPVAYKSIYPAPDGSFIARQDNKASILDKKLQIVIPPDTAEVILSEKKYFISVFKHAIKVFDKSGKLLKTIAQENLKPFSVKAAAGGDSLFLAHGRVVNIYDMSTSRAKTFYFYEVGDFDEEGVAIARPTYSEYIFIDKEGTRLNKTNYTSVMPFTEGIAAVQEKTSEAPYLVNRTFTKITTLDKVFHGPYSEGLAKVLNRYDNNAFYFLDRNGKQVFSGYGTDVHAFKEGRVLYKANSGTWQFADRTGKVITKDGFESAMDFNRGVAAAKRNGKWGIIDTAGNVVISFQFDGISAFSDGVAVAKSGTDFFLIDRSGKPVDNVKYAGGTEPNNGSFPVKKGSKFGLVDSKGKVIIPFIYDYIYPLSEGVAWATKNKKMGLVNHLGKELTTFEFDNASAFKNGYAQVQKGRKIGLIDKTGKIIIPIKYDQAGTVVHGKILLAMNEGDYKVALP